MKTIALLIAIVALAACGDSADNNANNHQNNDHENNEHQNNEVTPAADACEHMTEGPEQALTAVAAGETPPSITETHTRYDITIADGAGLVAIEVGEATEMSFFFDSNVTLTVTDASEMTIAIEEEVTSVDECSEVIEGTVLDLEVGTYNLLIETDQAEVAMVPVTSTHEHDEEE